MTHTFDIRVYYEDTDLAGIVYYANYLKFIERGRSEWVRTLGVDQTVLKASGFVFVVRKLAADYLKSAVYDDVLQVRTTPKKMGSASFELRQEVWRDDECLFTSDVTLVFVGSNGRAARIPADIRRLLAGN